MQKNRGRPEFQPTIEQRITVERMKAVGEDDTVIARALGVSVPTLKKHLSNELATGHAQQRARIVNQMFEAAASGNITAQKALEQLTRPPAKAAEMPVEKPGKKAAADAAALTVDDRLRPPAGPSGLRVVK